MRVPQHLGNAFFGAGGERLHVGKEIRWGYLVVAAFFGGILLWSALAPLSTAALAPGVVTVDGYRKTVQHLEGGIVEKIHVRDGSRVVEGEPLVELQRVASETVFNLLQAQRALALAEEARLVAEQNDWEDVEFPEWLLQMIEQPDVFKAVDGQRDIFEARRNRLQKQLVSVDGELKEAQSELFSYHTKASTLERKRRLVRREVGEFRTLAEKGLLPRTQLFAMERMAVEVDESISSNEATIAAVEQRIGQLEAKRSSLLDDHVTGVTERLRETQDKLIDIEHRIGEAHDRLERTTIRAPVDGVVVNLQVHTVGGVIKQGEGVLDLVPADAELIVEARIDPKDRDVVKADMAAEIRFSAFNQRAFQPIAGSVLDISADAVQQAGTAKAAPQSFYLAKIRLTEDPEEVLEGARIQPGMQADVLIVTGKRTALEYLVAPLFRSFNRALHEH